MNENPSKWPHFSSKNKKLKINYGYITMSTVALQKIPCYSGVLRGYIDGCDDRNILASSIGLDFSVHDNHLDESYQPQLLLLSIKSQSPHTHVKQGAPVNTIHTLPQSLSLAYQIDMSLVVSD
jgi:hypothetical protein